MYQQSCSDLYTHTAAENISVYILKLSIRPQFCFVFSIMDKVEYIYNRENPKLGKRYHIDHVKTCHGSVLYGRQRFENTNQHRELKLNEVLMCDSNEEL